MPNNGSDPEDTSHGRNGGYTVIKSASKTRPGNTTQYTINDVINESTTVGTILTFTDAGRTVGNSGIINSVQIIDSGNVATKPVLALWLFSAAPATVNDGEEFGPTDAELEDSLIGIVTFSQLRVGDPTANAAGNYVLQAKNENLEFVCADTSKDIYGILQVLNAYTPLDSEKFTVKLGIFQD